MFPYLTRGDILGGLFTVALVAMVLIFSLISTRQEACMEVIVEHQERANRFRDELARASLSGSQAECTAHWAYLAELEAYDAKMAAGGYKPSTDDAADLAFQRRLTASKCPSL
ncbi:MAG TPA: hypothetical protein VE423_08950 [Microvirga sp.]|nr:hypothetical protein [Microvirga sp.]